MKADGLTVTVGVKMDIDRSTAEGCLKLVEMYVNDNPVHLHTTVKETGEISYKFVDEKEDDIPIEYFENGGI